MIVEIFMPRKLQALLGFYVSWIGKGIFFIFIAVLMLLPFDERVKDGKKNLYIYFIVAAVYQFVLAAFMIVLGVLSLLNVHKVHRAHPIVDK